MAENKPTAERAPARRDLFDELDLLRGWSPFRDLGLARVERAGRAAPAVDIHESDAAYVVTAEVPGCGKDDISLELHDDVLTISGEKKTEREEKKERARWVERTYGAFSRSFTLPSDAQVDRVAASFKDGVLTVEIPKKEERKPRVIKIGS